jgi:iron(III) transport system substrate-binding protein
MKRLRLAAAALAFAAQGACGASLVLYCSHDPDACDLTAKAFEQDTGIRTSVTRKATGEFYAQIRAERGSARADVWYGGTLDSFLQASAEGLFEPYRSPVADELAPWARRLSERTGYRVDVIYEIILGFGTNPGIAARKSLAPPKCWADLVKPQYRGEIDLSNPVTSGTGYTILATLVALYGEDGAFGYLAKLKPNVVRWTPSGTAQGASIARGEAGVGVTFVHEFVTYQLAGFPIDVAIPCEGTGAAQGGMAILAGAPHLAEAQRFVDWALGKRAMELANQTKNLIVPANAKATLRPEAARYADAKLVDVDPLKFGAPDERKRLLARWQREIGDTLR